MPRSIREIGDFKSGIAPVYILVGQERFLIDRATKAIREAAVDEAMASFNADVLQPPHVSAERIIGAARTLPMMAERRFVLARGLGEMKSDELDALAQYVANPSPSSVVVLVFEKIDGRSKLAKAAKDCWYDAEPPKSGDARQFLRAEAQARGHSMDAGALDALQDAIGTDLAGINDALERLSLYVGKGNPITDADVDACVAKVRVETIWALVDAITMKNRAKALLAVESLLSDREPPLRALSMIARQIRMVAKMREALAGGLRGPDAAKAAGAPPFKANELTEAARRFPMKDLERAFTALSMADQELKGSKCPPEHILTRTVLELTH